MCQDIRANTQAPTCRGCNRLNDHRIANIRLVELVDRFNVNRSEIFRISASLLQTFNIVLMTDCRCRPTDKLNPSDNVPMRLLHTMLRVGNLQRSIDFYTSVLGMKLLRTSENPEYKYSLAFVGYGNNPDHAELELTYNHGTDAYDMGTAYGHIALGVPDAYAACDKIKAAGGNVTREAGPVKGGSTVIAFVTDPDGYKIELIQRSEGAGGSGLR